MNYNFLLPEKPLPNYFRYIATFIGVLSISIGFYLKLSDVSVFYDFTTNHMKWFLFIALMIFLTSKNKIEDERAMELQLQISRIGFKLLLGAIMIFEGAALFGNSYTGYQNFYYFVISILGTLVLFLELFKNSDIIDLIEKHRTVYNIAMLTSMVILLYINRWLW